MKISLLHWILMGLGVVAIIIESIVIYRATQEIKEKDALISELQAKL